MGLPMKSFRQTVFYLAAFLFVYGEIWNVSTTTTTGIPSIDHRPFPDQKLDYNDDQSITSTDQHIIIPNEDFIQHICLLFNISSEKCNCEYLVEYNKNLTSICELPVEHEVVCQIDSSSKAQYIFSVIASLIGIIGNSIVLLVRAKSMNKSLHYRLIMGLATADLLFSIAQVVYYVPFLAVGCKWIYGRPMCSILPSFLGISSSLDIGFIVIIAAERYNAITNPLRKSIAPENIYAFTLINVVIGICSVIPMFMVYEISPYGTCAENWSNYPNGSLVYSWLLFIFVFLLPVTITAVMYVRSLRTVVSKTQQPNVTATNEVHFTSTKQMMENRRSLVIVLSLLIAFVLLSGPNRIVWLVIDHIGHENLSYDLYKGLKLFGVIPYSVHIMINPIIYSAVDGKFRNNVIALFKGKRNDDLRNSSQTINLTFEATNDV